MLTGKMLSAAVVISALTAISFRDMEAQENTNETDQISWSSGLC